VLENCVQICYDFFDLFGVAPKDHFHDELVKRLTEVPDKDKAYYAQYLSRIQALSPPTEDYVIRRISRFIQCREFESAAIQFAELVRDGEFEEAQNLMYKALRSGVERENLGCDYLFDFSSLSRRSHAVLVSTGVDALDKLIRGYSRSQFVCYLGGYKGKKSWALIHLAKVCVLSGLRVVYISHEMNQEQLETRFDRMYGAMTRASGKSEVVVRTRDPETGVFGKVPMVRPSVFDIGAVKRVRKVVAKFGGRLFIKKYPMGLCTTDELNRYLNYLERFEGVTPDVLINDYADIMSFKGRGSDPRHGINENYIAHKTIADERNMLVVTASQGRREAIRKKRPSQGDVAEDVRKLGNVDVMVGVCQTDEMVNEGMGSMWVVVNRDGPMDVGCSILMNLDIGQFCSASWID